MVLLVKLKRERRRGEAESQKIHSQKLASDNLLHNFLPPKIARELKMSGGVQPKYFESVSVLFTDFKNFKEKAQKLSAAELVNELDILFREFDEIAKANGLEKIKTIGDSYMAVCGVPGEVKNHAQRTVIAARQMLTYIEERNHRAGLQWEMRVGIHSGSIIAGLVGKYKLSYDVWGSTVNIANLLESMGKPGTINVSKQTKELLDNSYTFTYNDFFVSNGQEAVEMYYLS